MAKKLISEHLRVAIERSGKTRYRIHKETGIPESQLSRFVDDTGASLSLKTIDRLCENIGAELVLQPERMKRKRSTKQPEQK